MASTWVSRRAPGIEHDVLRLLFRPCRRRARRRPAGHRRPVWRPAPPTSTWVLCLRELRAVSDVHRQDRRRERQLSSRAAQFIAHGVLDAPERVGLDHDRESTSLAAPFWLLAKLP